MSAPSTLERHDTIAGGIGKELQAVYSNLVDNEGCHIGKKSECLRIEDMNCLMRMLKKNVFVRK